MKKNWRLSIGLILIILLITGCNTKKQELLKYDIDLVQLEKTIDLLDSYTYDTRRENGYKSFSNTELMQIALQQIEGKDVLYDHKDNYDIKHYKIYKDALLSYLIPIFGEEVSIDPNDPNILATYLAPHMNEKYNALYIEKYDQDAETFIVDMGGVGGADDDLRSCMEMRKTISISIEGDTLIVKDKAIYAQADDYGIYIFANPERSKTLFSESYSEKNREWNVYPEMDLAMELNTKGINVNKFLKEATTITQTFKITNNNYNFISSSF